MLYCKFVFSYKLLFLIFFELLRDNIVRTQKNRITILYVSEQFLYFINDKSFFCFSIVFKYVFNALYSNYL